MWHAVGLSSAVIEMKGRDGYSTTPVLLWGTAAAGWYFYLEGGREEGSLFFLHHRNLIINK